MTPKVGNPKPFAIFADRQTCGDAAFLRVAQPNFDMVREISFGELKCVNDLLPRSAAEQTASVRTERQSVKRLFDAGSGNDLSTRDRYDGDLVLAVTGM